MTKLGVSYFGQYDPRVVKNDIESIAKRCAWINLPVTEEDITFRQGNIRSTIAAAKHKGLEVWLSPWGVANVFGGEGLSQLPRNTPINGNDDALQIIHKWFDFANRSDADAILFDEVRSPDGTDSAKAIINALMATNGLRTILYYSGASDWTNDLAKHADNIGTDLYWPTDNTNRMMQKIIDIPNAAEKHLWIQGFRVRYEHHQRVRRSLDLAKASGVDYVGIWGYHGSVTMSTLECDAPDLFWSLMGMN